MQKPLTVKEYVTDSGKSPFREWLDSLDNVFKARVQARIFRFELGNLGDYKSVGDAVLEVRLDFGPGFRIYFGLDGGKIILLLMGGSKSTQSRDIKKAQALWLDYKKR
ncbi:MAG: type II toxin-antitoxin system RelE/ParE family toxin [Oligoflexia bacterium]|nr:type II toxin-antitoxin system RelE/ParE family toxin [Oligoflexia bacterium]